MAKNYIKEKRQNIWIKRGGTGCEPRAQERLQNMTWTVCTNLKESKRKDIGNNTQYIGMTNRKLGHPGWACVEGG